MNAIVQYCGKSKCKYCDTGMCTYEGNKECTHTLDIHNSPIFEGDTVRYSAYDDNLELVKEQQEQQVLTGRQGGCSESGARMLCDQEQQAFTYEELTLLECVLATAIFGCDNRIGELKRGNQRDANVREQLEINEKSKADYERLKRKVHNEVIKF